MTIQIESVANPRYSNAAGTMIICDVKFSHLGEVVEFAASPNDVEAHGRAIHAYCAAGSAGPIAAYVKPQSEIDAEAVQAKNAEDTAAARAYAKLTALKGMSPARVQAWVAANVTNLAQAQDAITTLAIAISILARRL